jgi:hypothetical protein
MKLLHRRMFLALTRHHCPCCRLSHGRNPSYSTPEEEEENFEGRGDSLRKNKRYYHRLLGGCDQCLERERERERENLVLLVRIEERESWRWRRC